ncbi:MAG: hypothetical protein R6V42_01725 [Orrella sp.]
MATVLAATLVAALVTVLVGAALVGAAFAFDTGFIFSFTDFTAGFVVAFLAGAEAEGVFLGATFLAAVDVDALATFFTTAACLTVFGRAAAGVAADFFVTAVAFLAVALLGVFTGVLTDVLRVGSLAVVVFLVLVWRRVVVIIALCVSHLIRVYRHQTAGGVGSGDSFP